MGYLKRAWLLYDSKMKNWKKFKETKNGIHFFKMRQIKKYWEKS